MKFIFIDETSKEKENKCFLCLCGILIDSNKMIDLEKEIKNFKRKYEFNNLKEFRKPVDKKK